MQTQKLLCNQLIPISASQHSVTQKQRRCVGGVDEVCIIVRNNLSLLGTTDTNVLQRRENLEIHFRGFMNIGSIDHKKGVVVGRAWGEETYFTGGIRSSYFMLIHRSLPRSRRIHWGMRAGKGERNLFIYSFYACKRHGKPWKPYSFLIIYVSTMIRSTFLWKGMEVKFLNYFAN